MLKIEEIKVFMKGHPILTQRGISLESNISSSLLGKILRGQRSLTEEVSKKLEPTLKKYGYHEK